MKEFLSTLLGIVLVVLIFIGIFQGTYANEMNKTESTFTEQMIQTEQGFSSVRSLLGS